MRLASPAFSRFKKLQNARHAACGRKICPPPKGYDQRRQPMPELGKIGIDAIAGQSDERSMENLCVTVQESGCCFGKRLPFERGFRIDPDRRDGKRLPYTHPFISGIFIARIVKPTARAGGHIATDRLPLTHQERPHDPVAAIV